MLLRVVAREAQRLERERVPCALVMAQLLRAAVAARRGDHDGACACLREVQRGGAEAEMGLFAAVAKRREGELTAGDAGTALVADADDWMTRHGVMRPARIADLFAPGFAAPDQAERRNGLSG